MAAEPIAPLPTWTSPQWQPSGSTPSDLVVRFCIECGSGVDPTANFCEGCGAAIQRASP